MTDERPAFVSIADDAYEAVRTLNHLTIWRGAIPAPDAYTVLGNLKAALGYGAAQALRQLADRLEESPEEYVLREDDGRDPAESIREAAGRMRAAADAANMVGAMLSSAQNAIAGQSAEPLSTEG